MYTRSLVLTLIVAALFLLSCSKKSDSGSGGPNSSDISLVISGKGVRKIAEVFNWNQEDKCFQNTASIGWDGSNRVEWIHNFTSLTTSVGLTSYKGYRRAFHFTTGDSLAAPTTPPNFSAKLAGEPGDYYNYPQGSTTLWYYNPNLTYEGSSKQYVNSYGRNGIYANGDYITTNYSGTYKSQNGGFIKNLNTYYSVNGVEKGITYFISSGIEKDLSRCQGAGLDASGRPLLFILTGDSMKVVNAETKLQIAATATNAMSAPYTSPNAPKGNLYVHRSKDLTKLVITLVEALPASFSNTEYYAASYVFNVNTNTISAVVPRTLLDDYSKSLNFNVIKANDNGELFYVTSNDAIGKVDASGKGIFKTGFVGSKDIHVTYFDIIQNKLFVVVGISVDQYYIGQVKKARSALCVIE